MLLTTSLEWIMKEPQSPEEIDRMLTLLQFAGFHIFNGALEADYNLRLKYPYIGFVPGHVGYISLFRKIEKGYKTILSKEELIKHLEEMIKNESTQKMGDR